MSRYFVRPARVAMSIVHSYDDWDVVGNAWHVPAVSDHEAADTGLLDMNGDTIMRAPNPIGFGKDEEW